VGHLLALGEQKKRIALGRLSAELIEGRPLPGDITACGVTAAALAPARLR